MKHSTVLSQLSAALLVQATATSITAQALVDESSAAEPPKTVKAGGVITRTKDAIAATLDSVLTTSDGATVFHKTISPPRDWTRRTQNRYLALAESEALGAITPEEQQELVSLHQLRQVKADPPSGDELLQRYRREKMDRAMLELVAKYVRFQG